MRISFISWGHPAYQSHTDLLARHLNARMHYIHYGMSGKLSQAPIRFPIQAWRTWNQLRRDRPDVVFVQNPPIFCAFIAFLYGRWSGARYVIDSHTGAFLTSRWRSLLWLHRILSNSALITIVHNDAQAEIVRRWGCSFCMLSYIPGDYAAGEYLTLRAHFNIAVICSFLGDEPIDLVFEAASHLTKVNFYFTGDSNRIDSRMLIKKPDNCYLTGYLPKDQYVGLLRGVDVIMALTTRDSTLLMGAFEAVSLGKPLIVSDWLILRDYFSRGIVYIPNTVEGICEGVRRAQHEQATLQKDILILRNQLQADWEKKFANLRHLLQKC